MISSKRVLTVAKAVSFPDRIEVQFQPVDELGQRIGTSCYRGRLLTWEQVQNRFGIDAAYAEECEGYFREGQAAIIQRASVIEADWIEEGEGQQTDLIGENTLRL
jgi:hypothetical protein